MILQILVQDQVYPLFRLDGRCQIVVVGTDGRTNCLSQDQEAKQRERGRPQDLIIPFESKPPRTGGLPTSQRFSQLCGDQVFNIWIFGGHSRPKQQQGPRYDEMSDIKQKADYKNTNFGRKVIPSNNRNHHSILEFFIQDREKEQSEIIIQSSNLY